MLCAQMHPLLTTVLGAPPKLPCLGFQFCTHPDRNGQSCSFQGRGRSGQPTAHVRQCPQGLGSLPHGRQNTQKRFPRSPAHCAQLLEQTGSLILGATLHEALKLLPGLSACSSPRSEHPRPEGVPHMKCFPDGSQCLPPSFRTQTPAANTHPGAWHCPLGVCASVPLMSDKMDFKGKPVRRDKESHFTPIGERSIGTLQGQTQATAQVNPVP